MGHEAERKLLYQKGKSGGGTVGVKTEEQQKQITYGTTILKNTLYTFNFLKQAHVNCMKASNFQ